MVGTLKERLVSNYEFEFYTEECPGGLQTEGVLHPAKRGGCSVFKPGQKQQMVLYLKLVVVVQQQVAQQFMV